MFQARNLFLSFLPLQCGSPAGGKCQRRLHTHRGQFPGLTWGQPPAQPWSSLSWWEPFWVWSWVQAFQCCARLAPNSLWPCLPSMRCLLVPRPSLFPLGFGTPSSAGPGAHFAPHFVGLPPEADHGFQHWSSIKLLSPNLFIVLQLKWNLFFLFLI